MAEHLAGCARGQPKSSFEGRGEMAVMSEPKVERESRKVLLAVGKSVER